MVYAQSASWGYWLEQTRSHVSPLVKVHIGVGSSDDIVVGSWVVDNKVVGWVFVGSYVLVISSVGTDVIGSCVISVWSIGQDVVGSFMTSV